MTMDKAIRKEWAINFFAALTAVSLLFLVLSCASMKAIESREISVSAKMSDTIFLDPEAMEKNRIIYVRVMNTSDFQEIDFDSLLRNKIASKGYTITNSPSEAGYILQANLLYMGVEKESLTAEGMLAGGFGGGLAGSTIGSGSKGPAAGAVGGAIVGSVIGGIVGSMIHVDTYLGAVDIQIKETVEGGVQKTVETDVSSGMGSKTVTEHQKFDTKQEYRTRIVVKATQTNINRITATQIITNKLAEQISGIF